MAVAASSDDAMWTGVAAADDSAACAGPDESEAQAARTAPAIAVTTVSDLRMHIRRGHRSRGCPPVRGLIPGLLGITWRVMDP